MALQFSAVTSDALRGFTASAPRGAVVGILGDNASGASDLLAVAESQGAVVFGHAAIASLDAFGRARFGARLHDLRREGRTILLATHELQIISDLTDEVWWLRDGGLAAQGHSSEIVPMFQHWIVEQLRVSAIGKQAAMLPSMRRGDGRASLVSLETLGADGVQTIVWRSGEEVAVRVVVRFAAPVANPVVGILIRTRIGVEVYGTNTELEKATLGSCGEGDERSVLFRFRCDLCPKEYTLTAASHDPDGVWHDWMEDAVAFSVTDTRYTAGVANLRARVVVTA